MLRLFYLQFLGHKGELIHGGLDALAQRHPRPMPCPCLHPNQDRIRPRLRRLKRGRVLEAVRRKHPVVMVSRQNQRRRVTHALPYVMQRRVLVNRGKLSRILRRRTILLLPRPPDRELVETQHIHHPDMRHNRPKKVRPLQLAGRHQQPPIAPTGDRKPF